MFRFDPDRVAYLEAEGWRAYYDRRWLAVLQLLITMCQDQFHIPFPLSIVAAFYATRAAMIWVPVDHDARAVLVWYTRFYRLARRYSGLHFDPRRAAALELEYNDVHRELVGVEDKSRFVDTMTRLHSEIFNLRPEEARESAEQRVVAANIVDRITSGNSTNPSKDWEDIQAALRRCYRSVQKQLPAADPESGAAYSFTSNWEVAAPIQTVWGAIYDSLRWPTWWRYVAAVEELSPGDPNGLGSARRYTWTTALPYKFVFDSTITRIDPPSVLEAAASGQLNGIGRWTLTPDGSTTHVRYDWNVNTGVQWMNAVAPIARPLFAWNHNIVMREGGESLGKLLGVEVRVA